MRRFVVVGQRARTARDFPLDDLCGAGGRWDLLARCVQASLFVSHDLRRDTELALVLMGPPEPPKTIRLEGAEVRNLNPDERSTVALLSRALEEPLPVGPMWRGSLPGLQVARRGLDEVLSECVDGPLVLLDENGAVDGQDLPSYLGGGGATFVLGDDRGLTEDQLALVRSRDPLEVRLGPVSLHADHCIAIVHNILDRAIPG